MVHMLNKLWCVRVMLMAIKNSRGNIKKMSLADDCVKYKMAAVLTQKTRILGNIVEEIITSDGKDRYNHHTSGLERNTRY